MLFSRLTYTRNASHCIPYYCTSAFLHCIFVVYCKLYTYKIAIPKCTDVSYSVSFCAIREFSVREKKKNVSTSKHTHNLKLFNSLASQLFRLPPVQRTYNEYRDTAFLV